MYVFFKPVLVKVGFYLRCTSINVRNSLSHFCRLFTCTRREGLKTISRLPVLAALAIIVQLTLSAGALGQSPSAPTDGSARYLSPSGNDDNNGLYPEWGTGVNGPWRTIAKVHAASLPTSTDLYFENEGAWAPAQLFVEWSGTASDPAVIGAFYCIGGSCFIGLSNPGNKIVTPPDSGSRPSLRGTYLDSCSPALGGTGGCLFDHPDAVPRNYGGIIYVGPNMSHITVQHLHVANSAYHSFSVSDNGDRIIFDDVISEKSAGSAFVLLHGTKNSIIRNSVGDRMELSWYDFDTPIWGTAVAIASGRGTCQNNLIEKSLFTRAYGEGLGFLPGSNCNVARHNILADIRRPAIYSDGGSNLIIEGNVVLGDGTRMGPPQTIYDAGIAVATEPYHSESALNVIIRGNFIANTGNCIDLGGSFPTQTASGVVSHNACLFPRMDYILTYAFATFDIFGNYFYGDSMANGCADNAGGTTFDFNGWEILQNDARCRGANDTIGGPDLSFDFSAAHAFNRPAITDFVLGPLTAFDNVGPTLPNLLLDLAVFSVVFDFASGICDPSPLQWAAQWGVDSVCTVPSSPSDLGPLENGN